MSERDGTIERDLAALDAALASGAARDDDPRARQLQELALLLRAESATPGPAFAERLDERVAAGFPPEPGSARARAHAAAAFLDGAPRRVATGVRRLAPAVGVIGLILLPIVLVATLAGGPGSGGGDGGDGGAAVQERSGGAAIAPGGSAPADGGFAPGRSERRIERSISLELDVALEDLARVAEDVTAVTNRHGGFVLSSSVDTGEESGGGDFSLRIPSDRLRPALRDLAALAPVIRQTQEGRDVTREHVTARDRLQAARAERRSLLRRLAGADTDAEAEAIRRRLDLVAGEINGLRARLRDLRLRTDYAVVLVSLIATEDGVDGGATGSFDDAIGDTGDLLVATAGLLIRALALALPIGLIALLAWVVSRGVRRRRRESVLA